MEACRSKKVSCIKVEADNCAQSTNNVEVAVVGPDAEVPMTMEADTGANITVVRAENLENLDWIEIEPTNVHIKGYSGTAEPCLGHAKINLRRGGRSHLEDVFFSNTSTANFLSKDACKALAIIPKRFPFVQLHSVKGDENGCSGQNTTKVNGTGGHKAINGK